MNSKNATDNENQSLRIAQDSKRYNWLLNKIKIRQDSSFRTKIRPSVPVSVSLAR